MNNKYKVLIVHNYYQVPGGEDTVVKNEGDLLKANGHDVYLYTRSNDEIESGNIFTKTKLFFNTIFSFKTYRDVKKIIKEKGIDIVHVHNTLPLVSPSVYYAAFSRKVPVVQTIHNFRFLSPCATLTRNNKICEECITRGLHQSLKFKCYRNSFIQTFAVYIMLKIHRMINTYNKINGYITLTEFNKIKLLNLIKDEEKIFIKPNFVKLSDCRFTQRSMKNFFVYFGRLDKLKGINLLVDVWKNIDNEELYIIGDGPERDNIKKIINENKLTNVKMLGFMKREEAFNILKDTKALIVPSQWYEGFPMTIVEAFSLGVPVIASDIGNLSSIINNRNGLLFKHNDISELINKIKKMSLNRELNKELNNGAYETYENLYSDKINYKQLLNVYIKLRNDVNGNM